MSKGDYYKLLGVSSAATPQQIRAAHRTLVRRYHPDTAADGRGDPQRFALVQDAYEVLSNKDLRRRYDQKMGIESGAIPTPGPRRPPKAACGACGAMVYASQLRLHLGRHMCKPCIDRRRLREDRRRLRVTGINELRWRLAQWRVWAASHVALISLVFLALLATGARLATVGGTAHRSGSPLQAAPAHWDSSPLPAPPSTQPSQRLQ